MTIVHNRAQQQGTGRVTPISDKRASGFPDYAIELEAALSGPVVDLEQVVKMIVAVPDLGARLLIFANSELVGLSHCVLDVPEAIILLGTERLRALVLGYAVMKEIASPRQSCPIRRNWPRGCNGIRHCS